VHVAKPVPAPGKYRRGLQTFSWRRHYIFLSRTKPYPFPGEPDLHGGGQACRFAQRSTPLGPVLSKAEFENKRQLTTVYIDIYTLSLCHGVMNPILRFMVGLGPRDHTSNAQREPRMASDLKARQLKTMRYDAQCRQRHCSGLRVGYGHPSVRTQREQCSSCRSFFRF
jgi:hypothetical protein